MIASLGEAFAVISIFLFLVTPAFIFLDIFGISLSPTLRLTRMGFVLLGCETM